MFKTDALEAAPIVIATLRALLAWAPTQGRSGAGLRTAVNDVIANVFPLLHTDTIGPPLATCFDLAVETGANLSNIEKVRTIASSTGTATLAGAITIRDSLVQFCLVTQARIIADMNLTSRIEVEKIKSMFNDSFNKIEEDIANRMDAMTYRAIIELRAAISFYLVETARPLPRMLRYRFNLPMSTLVMSQRLYYDASRADELRNENKVVHPGFSPMSGLAMSN
jgi:prophage DNA circulation protein